MKSLGTLLVLMLLASYSFGQDKGSDITGIWLNDEKNAHVEIYEKDGAFFGKIIWLKDPNLPDGTPKVDANNPKKSLRSRNVLGMDIISHLSYKDHGWEDGTIYLPKKGQILSCEATLSDNKNELTLMVSKFWFSTTIKWTRL